MGHLGRKPIRLTWLFVVFPALAVNYLAQGALLLAEPAAVRNPATHTCRTKSKTPVDRAFFFTPDPLRR
jgi:K+ transporter